jgi:hypothetical protein
LEASKSNEDAAFLDVQEAINLTGMVEEHMASLPLRLAVHASPQAAYWGKEVPPPLGAPPRLR